MHDDDFRMSILLKFRRIFCESEWKTIVIHIIEMCFSATGAENVAKGTGEEVVIVVESLYAIIAIVAIN